MSKVDFVQLLIFYLSLLLLDILISFNSLFASMSNHMAKRVNRLELMNENMAASALIGGI